MNLRELLAAGDLRTIGRSNEIADYIGDDQSKFDEIFCFIGDQDRHVALRSSDACEKASRKSPKLLKSHANDLVNLSAAAIFPEVVWHCCQMIPRVELNPASSQKAIDSLLERFQNSPSRIAKTSALESLVRIYIALGEKGSAAKLVEEALHSPIPSTAARARHLVKLLE